MSAGTLFFLILIVGALLAMFAVHRSGAGTGMGCGGHGHGSPHEGEHHSQYPHGEGRADGQADTGEPASSGRHRGCC